MCALLSWYLSKRRNSLVGQHLRGDVLDIGCGEGPIIPFLSDQQCYVGIESCSDLVSALQRRFSKYRFYCRDVDNEPLSLGDQEFDTVMVVAVIEHLAHPERVLQEARSYLRPRGLLIITTPTPIGHVIHRVGARLGLFSLESAKDHKMMYDFDALSLLLKRSGFQVVKYEKFELGANQLFVCMKS